MEIYFDDRSGKNVQEELVKKMESVLTAGLERVKSEGADVSGNTELSLPFVSGNIELSLSFVPPEEIRALNRDYRGKDAVTDVLSFAANEGEAPGFNDLPEDFPVNLGDIVICVARAEEQAAEYGHGFEREMCFLAAHGLLHLLGYGHEDEAGEREMISLQEEILNAAGVTRPPIS